MKKWTALALTAVMLFTLAACTGKPAPAPDADEPGTEAQTTLPTADSGKEETVGQTLLKDFKQLTAQSPDQSAEELAEALLSNPILTFGPAVMPVEPGLLTGFGNTEIKGFSQGAMFAPMISTIPFVGYIFVLDADTDADAFMQTLKDNADLNWNICTQAEELVVDRSGSTVFFLMCRRSMEG